MKLNYTHALMAMAIGVLVGGALVAQKPEPVDADPIDMIIENSHQTMQKAAKVSAMADKVVVEQVQEMKATIEVLEEEKVMLVQQVNVMQNEIVSIKSAPVQPFDVLAILPDSTGGGE
jgi:hypothetical protein